MVSRRKIWTVVTALSMVLMLLMIAGCSSPRSTESPAKSEGAQKPGVVEPSREPPRENAIKVGVAVSLTGMLSREGSLVRDGYQFWEETVNSRGGINIGGTPYRLQMIYYDDRSDAQTSAKLVEKLITEDKVDFVLGPYSSGIAQATSAIAEKYKMVNILSMANADSIFQQGFKYTFGVFVPGSKIFTGFANMVASINPHPKGGIITPDSLFPVLNAESVKKKLEENKVPVVLYEKFPADLRDFSTVIGKIKQSGARVLVTPMEIQLMTQFVRQAKEMNLNLDAIGTIVAQIPDFVKVLGKDGEYICGDTAWFPGMPWKDDVFGTAQEYAEKFEKRFGYPPTHYSACPSCAGVVLQKALEKAGKPDREEVRKVLSSTSFETFFGPVRFSDTGLNVEGTTYVSQLQGGKPVLVFPENIAQAKLVYPMPAWKDRK